MDLSLREAVEKTESICGNGSDGINVSAGFLG